MNLPEYSVSDVFADLLKQAREQDAPVGMSFDTPNGKVELWTDENGQRVVVAAGRELRLDV